MTRFDLIVLEFNDTSSFVDHFVSTPKEREKRESRGKSGTGEKEENEETEEIKTFPLYPYLLQG